jgi:hypothetical protein
VRDTTGVRLVWLRFVTDIPAGYRDWRLRLSESLEKFSVAVVATDDGRFAYQVFLVCGEPRTLLTDSARYLTPADAAQAGYEAVASMSETPVRRPYAPSSSRHHRGTPSQASD